MMAIAHHCFLLLDSTRIGDIDPRLLKGELALAVPTELTACGACADSSAFLTIKWRMNGAVAMPRADATVMACI